VGIKFRRGLSVLYRVNAERSVMRSDRFVAAEFRVFLKLTLKLHATLRHTLSIKQSSSLFPFQFKFKYTVPRLRNFMGAAPPIALLTMCLQFALKLLSTPFVFLTMRLQFLF
jgi:hypothetical protein